MNVKQYLENQLKNCSRYNLIPNDEKLLKKEKIQKYAFKKLTSKKFRRWKLDPECEKRTKKALRLSVGKNKPLVVVYPVGAYKLWRLPSFPEVDWSEFFNIAYILKYLAPVVAAYKKDVVLYYYMHSLLMEAHDNLTTKEVNQYIKSFQVLADSFSKYLPKNLKIKIWKDADIYTRKEYFATLEKAYKNAKKEYEAFPEEKKQDYFRMSELNIKWKGRNDWTKLSQKEKKEKMIRSAIYETSAGYGLTKAINKVKADNHVLVFTKTSPQFIGIGSCKTSIVKHWVGFGILEKEGGKFYERILSPSQFEKAKKQKHLKAKIDLIPLKNFKEIWVYPQKFNFVL
ncbi:MAG TPA: hypothetical protein VMW29_01800 [Candidatus Bathyarchaeia archaeon]|nr:hypothetical protein [Candidatus Bathyarchaeia archaeon]